jgi:hypothetical protein
LPLGGRLKAGERSRRKREGRLLPQTHRLLTGPQRLAGAGQVPEGAIDAPHRLVEVEG